MIGYIDSVRDTEFKLCTYEKFVELTTSERIETLIEEYRSGRNPSAKQMLPAFLFQGFDPNVLLGKKGNRRANHLVSNGLFMMDFDHVENPVALYEKFLQNLNTMQITLQDDVALAHITPSGKGLRIVMRLKPNITIETAQESVSKAIGVEADKVVKDLSRLSFVPCYKDVKFVNKELLFKNEQFNTEVSKPCEEGGTTGEGESECGTEIPTRSNQPCSDETQT